MILKILQRSLSRIQPRPAYLGLAFLFSNDKKGNQFDKFKRDKKSINVGEKASKLQQSQLSKDKEAHKQGQNVLPIKSDISKNQQLASNFTNKQKVESKGLAKFQRVKNQKTVKAEDNSEQKIQKVESSQKQQTQPKVVDSFSKFKRVKKTGDQVQVSYQQKEPEVSSMNKQGSKQKEKESNAVTQENPSKTTQTNFQNPPPSSLQQQGEEMSKAFSKFRRKNIEKHEKQQSLLNSKTKHLQTTKQQSVEENIMNSQTSQNGRINKKKNFEKQLKDKQQHFFKKVQEFKNLKNQEHRINKNLLMSFKKYFQQTEAQIEAFIASRLGIKFRSPPPLQVSNNPALLILWKAIVNVKFFLLTIFLFIFSIIYEWLNEMKQVSSEQVMNYVEKGEVRFVRFREIKVETGQQGAKKTEDLVEIILKNQERYKCISNSDFQKLLKIKILMYNELTNNQNRIYIENIKDVKKSSVISTRTFLSLILFYLFIRSLTSAGGVGGSKSKQGSILFEKKSKKFLQTVNIKFSDVVGMQKAKEQVMQFIDFLKFPQKYHQLGAKIPKGALLTGPPGTGKTMIAKACAGQSNVPFFTVSGSQFVEMYVGVGAQRVRDIFEQAKNAAPSIIFIDEIDAVGKKRSAGFGGNDERDNTLNQLLVEMDGFRTQHNVIVFAATNQKDILDPALIRPGRFDRLIQIDLPDLQGRKQIFMVHLKPIVIDQKSSIEQYARRMATLTPGFSGAEIKNLCNQAAIMAARNSHKFVTLSDFQLATERIIAGVQKKSHLITPETKKVVAYHECGHGIVSWFLQNSKPLLKITIIPRSKGSLGFAQYLPHETQISSKKQLEDQISVILGGRIAEEVFFGHVSTGAYDDLQKAYIIAKKIVTEYGMNKNIGWFSLEQSQYIQYYSKQTQGKIDKQIFAILKECGQRTRSIIQDKKELIQKLAQKLLELETIDLTKITQILGDRPFQPNKQYADYLAEYKSLVKQKVKQEKVDGDQNQDSDGGSKESGVEKTKSSQSKEKSELNKIEMKKRVRLQEHLI